MAYASRLYPRAKPRGFTLQWIKKSVHLNTLFFYYLDRAYLSG